MCQGHAAFVRVFVAFLTAVVFDASVSPAATIGYWRFEDSPGFLEDSSGNGNTLSTVGTVTQTPLPAVGPGSQFPTTIPQTGDANATAADFEGTSDLLRRTVLSTVPSTAFTVEALLHWEDSANNNESFSDVIASTRDASNNIGFFFQIRTDGFNGTDLDGELFLSFNDGTTKFVNSGFSPVPDTDYYMAVAFDMLDDVRFYVKDLTLDTPLQTFIVPHTGVGVLNPTASILEIGDSNLSLGNFDFDGLIDELRLSDLALPQSELLITATTVIPEPGSGALAFLGALGCFAVRRRRIAGRPTLGLA